MKCFTGVVARDAWDRFSAKYILNFVAVRNKIII